MENYCYSGLDMLEKQAGLAAKNYLKASG